MKDRIIKEKKALFNEIYVQKSALKDSHEILEKINLPYKIIGDEDEILGGKDTLLLAHKKGPFLKACPCSNDSLSCGYYNINVLEGCFFDCSYCILQLYLKDRPITIYTNFNDLFNELDEVTANKGFFRVGPGELADSLCLEEYTGIAKRLIEYFSNKNALLEIKTKDHRIDSLLKLDSNSRTVIAFSVNAETIVKSDEKGASDILDRVLAAKKAIENGYYVAFHFDPVILFPGWQDEYLNVIKLLSLHIPEDKIKWISVGLLRFPQAMKSIILANHRGTKILSGEILLGNDGKMRYFVKLRKSAYKFMENSLRQKFSNVCLYFCMETKELWKEFSHLKRDIKCMNSN